MYKIFSSLIDWKSSVGMTLSSLYIGDFIVYVSEDLTHLNSTESAIIDRIDDVEEFVVFLWK